MASFERTISRRAHPEQWAARKAHRMAEARRRKESSLTITSPLKSQIPTINNQGIIARTSSALKRFFTRGGDR